MRPPLFASANFPTPEVVIRTPDFIIFGQVLFHKISKHGFKLREDRNALLIASDNINIA